MLKILNPKLTTILFICSLFLSIPISANQDVMGKALFFLGLQLNYENNDEIFLIEFENYKKESVFIISGENQKFYNNLQDTEKNLRNISLKAKDLKVGSKILENNTSHLMVKDIIKIQLKNKDKLSNYLNKKNYTIFSTYMLNSKYKSFLLETALLPEVLACLLLGILFLKIQKKENVFFKGFERKFFLSKVFCKFPFIFAFSLSFSCFAASFISILITLKKIIEKHFEEIKETKMFNKVSPSALAQKGKITIAQRSNLFKTISQMSDYIINFASIDFLENKEFDKEANSNIYSEIIYDTENNPIKNENGKIAYLNIEKGKLDEQ